MTKTISRLGMLLMLVTLTSASATGGDKPGVKIAAGNPDVKADKPQRKVRSKTGLKGRVAEKDKTDAVTHQLEVAPSDAEENQPDEGLDVAVEQMNIDITGPLLMLFGGGAFNVQAIEMPVGPDAANQDDAMTEQFMQQYHHLMVAELSFVRMACSDLTPEQRPLIRCRAEASLKKAAKDMAKMQNRQMLGGIQRVAIVQPQPNQTIREGIAVVLAETLTEEQLAKYRTEADDRVAIRKQAAILCCVAHLDGALSLTNEQREKIVETISANWQETWENWLMLSNYGDQYFPTLPDQNIVPHLTKEQKSVWQGLQKIDLSGFWGGGRQNEFNGDGWWGNDVDQSPAEPAVARPAEIQEPGL